MRHENVSSQRISPPPVSQKQRLGDRPSLESRIHRVPHVAVDLICQESVLLTHVNNRGWCLAPDSSGMGQPAVSPTQRGWESPQKFDLALDHGRAFSWRLLVSRRRTGGRNLTRVTWTPEMLDKYVADPQAMIPANRMPYAGTANATDRTDLNAYLLKATK